MLRQGPELSNHASARTGVHTSTRAGAHFDKLSAGSTNGIGTYFNKLGVGSTNGSELTSINLVQYERIRTHFDYT